ncbi:hypothetical protein [Marinobacter caseinilyticus]|uniref:hypothetical protein n=1 Tax=Marinobacter caseinilyticus TaxID=2692195 RepID=UPI001409CEF5|nr:hypothetical protein [Marinobacter caseinilyticus]
MIQDSLKSGLDSARTLRQRIETQLRPQLDRATVEFKKVLTDLGADVSEPRPMSDVIARIRAKNPTFRSLASSVDIATYDLRKKLWWDANMMTAYVTDRAGQTYSSQVKPKFEDAINRAGAQLRQAMVQVRELTARNSRIG